ncbi:MAG: hypothetical protein HC845_14150 [Akkermansiaceae bacterium]|nr:hypothetical protein [Akkermansiaceae bacterium]
MKFSRCVCILLVCGLSTFAEAKTRSRKKTENPKEPAPVAAEILPGEILLCDSPDYQAPEFTALVVPPPTRDEIVNDETPQQLIPEKFLTEYFGARPQTFLVDPQGLLSPADSKDRLDFLNYHAGDSSIDIFVYLIGKDQEIPSEVRHEELLERFYSEGRPAAVVWYFLGNPQRSVIQLSPAIREKIPATEQHRTLENSVIQALEKTQPTEQLEKFLTQLSIRIYGMERILGVEQKAADSESGLQPIILKSQKTKEKKSQKLLWLREQAEQLAIPVGASAGGLFFLLGIIYFLRRRAHYVFPEFDVEPRLGGSHAAGIGAVISFSSAAVPPASQREQLPDYLRRG